MTATTKEKATNTAQTAKATEQTSNDAADQIVAGAPYTVTVTLEGTADLLFHRWSTEDVAAKAAAAKNSAAKKTDNVESLAA